MSTEVATPVAIPVAEPSTTTEPTAPVSLVEEETPKVEESKTETPSTPAATKEEHKKRSPFGDLKNKLFHKVSVSFLFVSS